MFGRVLQGVLISLAAQNVTVLPAALEPARCTLLLQPPAFGSTTAQAGGLVRLQITPRDAFGNVANATMADFVVTLGSTFASSRTRRLASAASDVQVRL